MSVAKINQTYSPYRRITGAFAEIRTSMAKSSTVYEGVREIEVRGVPGDRDDCYQQIIENMGIIRSRAEEVISIAREEMAKEDGRVCN